MAAEIPTQALRWEAERAVGHFFLDTKFVNVLTFKSSNQVLGETKSSDAINHTLN
jgi:hypothetical protein